MAAATAAFWAWPGSIWFKPLPHHQLVLVPVKRRWFDGVACGLSAIFP